MADSDEEYVQEISDDENGPQEVGYGTRSSGRANGKQNTAQSSRTRERWEDIQRSWDLVTEGVDGSLSGTAESLLEANKRKRLLRDTTPLQRGIIRHFILIIDMSSAMSERDLRPTRYSVAFNYAADFVKEFFEQNPISQIGIIGMRDGLAHRVSDVSGNPRDHLDALSKTRETLEPKGNPSLQNALELARGALFHAPTHGTREVLVIFGAVLTADPGDIHQTIRNLVKDRIRVSVIGLAARMAICEELCSKTNGSSLNDGTVYGVAIDGAHFRDLLFAQTTPPATRASTRASAPALLEMGFPSRIADDEPAPCACHDNETRGGYLCSRCKTKICSLPAQCPKCGLQLIQSTHLARSYHHLFPLRNYVEVAWQLARRKGSVQCFACLSPFPAIPPVGELAQREKERAAKKAPQPLRGVSESARYACTTCEQHFCIDCDVYAHEVIHNCAGCLSGAGNVNVQKNGTTNGHSTKDVDMG